MNLHQIDIREVDVEQVRPLRTAVLRPHYEEDQLLVYEGDNDDKAHHFAAIDTNIEHIVGVVSYLYDPIDLPGEAADIRLRGMAIAKKLRRQGLGSHLLSTTLPKIALYHRGSRLWASARVGVTDFYIGHGFKAVGPRFEMPQVGPHQRVIRDLPALIA